MTTSTANTDTQIVNIDVLKLAQDAVANRSGIMRFLIYDTLEDPVNFETPLVIDSSDHATASQRPQLTVIYNAMPSLQPILDAVQSRLETDGNLRSLVGRRIYHSSFPEDSGLPLVVYQLVDTPVQQYFNEAITFPIDLDVDVMFGSAETGNQAMVAAGEAEDRIAELLHQHEYTAPTGYQRMVSIVQNRGQRIRDFDLIRTSTRVRVWAMTNGG